MYLVAVPAEVCWLGYEEICAWMFVDRVRLYSKIAITIRYIFFFHSGHSLQTPVQLF